MTCPLEIRIPLSAPHIPKAAWRNVRDCLKTGWVSSVGAYVGQFERNMSRRIGAQHAVATVNGTAALHTALLTAGVGEGDEVLVSTLSFIAPANAIRYVGARPIFVDADPVYWQMDVSRVADFLGKECRWKRGGWINRQSGRRVRAILPVHILGHPCDMKPLLALARKYNLAVIEDATESLGSLYGGRPVGSLGDAACFSFNGNKIITTGGGGMMVTNRTRWARQARYLTTQAKTPGLEYIHHHVGYNYRLTNLQAALGCAELDQLDKYIGAKRRIALRYGQGLGALPGITLPSEASWAFSTFWLYTILARTFPLGSRGLVRALLSRGIEARPLWQPLHLSPAHKGSQSLGGDVSERLWAQAVSLPSSVAMTADQQNQVIRFICAGK